MLAKGKATDYLNEIVVPDGRGGLVNGHTYALLGIACRPSLKVGNHIDALVYNSHKLNNYTMCLCITLHDYSNTVLPYMYV